MRSSGSSVTGTATPFGWLKSASGLLLAAGRAGCSWGSVFQSGICSSSAPSASMMGAVTPSGASKAAHADRWVRGQLALPSQIAGDAGRQTTLAVCISVQHLLVGASAASRAAQPTVLGGRLASALPVLLTAH